jgi:deoxyribonuclease-1
LNVSTYCSLLAVLLLLPGMASCSDQSQSLGARLPDYETARSVFWKQLYDDGGTTLYCRRLFGSGYNRGINIEHVFPASWIAYDLRCGKRYQCRERSAEFNRMEADLHNLYPARRDINDARNNYRFANISGEARVFGKCDFEYDKRQRLAEPAPASRGKIARAMLYMADEYDLYLKPKQRQLLVDWDREYPPNQKEFQRNDRIEQIQGNRNRFIDAHR